MAQFPIDYSTRLPSGQGIGATVSAEAVAAPYRAIEQAGAQLGQVTQQIQRAENEMEFSTLKRKSEEIWNAGYNAMLSENDPQKRAEIYQKVRGDMESLSAKSEQVNRAMAMHLNAAMPQYDVYYSDLDRKKRIQSARAELETNSLYMLENNDTAGYESLLKTGLDTGLLTQAEYEYRKNNAGTDAKFAQARLLMNEDPVMAINVLENMPDLNGEQLDQKDRLVAHAKMRSKEVFESSNKDLADLMVSGGLTVGAVQSQRNKLSDVDYEQWIKIAYNKPDKPGNPIEAVTLESSAVDIWRGAVRREEFDERVRNSLADPNGINETEYATIMQKADVSLKATQAEDLRRFSRDGARVILEKYSGLLQFDASGNVVGINMANLGDKGAEEAKYRFHTLSMYEQGLRDWISDNPKASGKEFYQFAREQKLRYWNMDIETMKTMADREKAGLEPMEEPVIPAPKTKDEFDKLPSGTIFFAPDGTKRKKP